MRAIARLIFILSVFSGMAFGQSPITITVQTNAPGIAIPADFAGLSFESSNLLPDKQGAHLFSAENKPLIELFRTVGIKNLRVGGGTADGPEFKIPGPADIDALFAFAKAADIDVIYTLRLLNGNKQRNAELAAYIQQHYASQLVAFEIGNEPDWHSFHTSPGHPRDPNIVEATPEVPGTAYPSYITDWKQFAEAILKSVPGARFTGPDTGSNYPVPGTKDTDYDGASWTQHFAADTKGMNIPFVTHHDYSGQSAAGVAIPAAIDAMLSREWPAEHYKLLYDHVLQPVEALGKSYRMTECNDYTGGVNGASNAFASALWALDYMYWHAEHGAVGVNFHNKSWIFTDTVYKDSSGEFQFNPKAYAIRAFDLGSAGKLLPLTVSNADGINLTAYAVRGPHFLFLTIINKEHGAGARDATVTVVAPGVNGQVAAMSLQAPQGDPGAKSDVTLGGASIVNGTWDGKWSEVGPSKKGEAQFKVPATSAVVLRVAMKKNKD